MSAPATWIDPEERCYPSGGFLRRARVELRANPHNPVALAYGELRMVRAGIADTFFTVPARLRVAGRTVKGFISTPNDDVEGRLYFTPEADPEHCGVCAAGEGCRK